MASRFGPRAVGTDGSDYRHRHRVASHYRDSVVNKYRLKVTLLLHSALLTLILVKNFLNCARLFEIGRAYLPSVHLPSSYFWEYWWLCSGCVLIIASSALAKNNATRIRRAYFLLFLLGLMPITVAAGLLVPQLMAYSKRGESNEYFQGFPVIVLWYIFFTVAFQVHVFTMFFITKLALAWQPNTYASQTKAHAS